MKQFSEIDAAISRRLYQASVLPYAIGVVLAAMLVLNAYQHGEASSLTYLWLALIDTAYIARFYLSLAFHRNNLPDISWLTRFRAGIILTGILWGTGCFLLFPADNPINQLIVILAILGICASAAIAYSVDLISLFGFAAPILLSLLIRLYVEETTSANTMALMTLLFMVFIASVAKKSNQTILQNIELTTTSAAREKREKSYARIMGMIANNAPLNETLEFIVTSMETQNPDFICSIIGLDKQGKHLLHTVGPSLPEFYIKAITGLEIGPNVGSCGASAYTGMRVIVEDIQSHPNWAPYKELTAKAELAACWSEPIKSSTGKVLGSLAVYRRAPASPSDDDLEVITHNAYLAGIAIERADYNKEQTLASMFYQNTNECMMICDAKNRIIAVNPAFTSITGYSAEEVIGKNPSMLSSGRQDKAFYQELWHQLTTTGKWQGEVWNRNKNGELYLEWLRINTIFDANGAVLNYVSLATDITKKKESEDIIWRQANFDPLTNLPNRRMFNDRLNQEIKKTHRADLPLALMFIDLDHFKEINDTLGHAMGDVLLIEAAKRLVGCVRDTDTVGLSDHAVSRLGGDEFTIVLGELRDINCVELIAQRILDKLSEPYQLGSEKVYISASIGITLYPMDSMNADTLLKNADQAMYAAKRLGRNRFSFFTESMQVTVQNRMRLTNDLRDALGKNQLYLLYQPIVDLSTGQINKAEALIRWRHPINGNISPAEFIPIAEDTGLIMEIGDWVFTQATEQVALWRQSIHPDFQISINKSPVQFFNNTNKKSHLNWTNHLKKLGLPGQSISVEITERLLLDSSNAIRDQLLELRDNGVQVSLDDFGTGYSSLSYIKKFDIDYIKIDQSFVRNLESQTDDMAVCEAIIVMAHKLGMMVIAEGVETEQQCNLLKAIGCDYGQGYYFSRPIAVEEFEKLFA
ncbi:MAG TPA: EAL domain-containing protein [Methylophilus sp.]|nr:EAL domain-containing protein [Methylophilus sp.]HQQ33743.1 EAL domain-containing protein [Methylophilus sp.]